MPDVAVIGAGALRIAEDARLGPEDVSATMGSRTDSAGNMESLLYDRLAGRELEHELISGAITRRAGRHACRHRQPNLLRAARGAASGRVSWLSAWGSQSVLRRTLGPWPMLSGYPSRGHS